MIKIIGVIGAGQMGSGIAQVLAQAGYEVVLQDISLESLNVGKKRIETSLKKLVEKQKLTEIESLNIQKNIQKTQHFEDLSRADFIIEAVSENIKLKNEIFKKLDALCKDDVILATNTSSISVTGLAAQTNRPDKVIGVHFMNPVPVMKLVEVIRAIQTSDETFSCIKNICEKIGKVCVQSKDYPGFIVNRILMPMINEACYALYEGLASVEDIDNAMKLGTNQPMGPLTLADFIGLDTCLAIMNVLHEGLGDSKYRPCPLLKQYVLAGYLGKKSGKGFYTY